VYKTKIFQLYQVLNHRGRGKKRWHQDQGFNQLTLT